MEQYRQKNWERSIFGRIEQDFEQHGVLKYVKINKRKNNLDDEMQLNILVCISKNLQKML